VESESFGPSSKVSTTDLFGIGRSLSATRIVEQRDSVRESTIDSGSQARLKIALAMALLQPYVYLVLVRGRLIQGRYGIPSDPCVVEYICVNE